MNKSMKMMAVLCAALVSSPAFAHHGKSKSSKGHQRASTSKAQVHVVHVRPDHAATGEVDIFNQTGRSLELYVDGDFVAMVAAGHSELRLPLGTARLKLVSGDRVVSRKTVEVRRTSDIDWRVDAPEVGVVVVNNPLPIPVEVVCSRGLVRTIKAFESTTYSNQGLGTFRLTARRLNGVEIGGFSTRVDGWDVAVATVPKPRTGLLVVDNDTREDARIYIDGQLVGAVGDLDQTVLELRPGDYRVDVVAERGRYDETVASRRVEIELYDNTWVEVDARPASGSCSIDTRTNAGHVRPY